MAVLETPRLFLREMVPGDKAALCRVLSDEESMRHYPHAYSEAEVENWIRENTERYRVNGFGLWAVVLKSDGSCLGDCGITLQNIDGETLPEIGFHIIREYCGRGYASEAAAVCLEYAVKTLGFPAVYSYSRSGNVASQRVSEKIGMKKIKTYRRNDIEYTVMARLPLTFP
ncbi:GNAT family N-acetyltransferase [Breznakiella homolactica]|uniref:GNAT family N-acetyltransferase n=1 Tax=Breznakiella homolactica TaxID=2798577 RepID=A0A7T7XPI6_9SPIR|nr:GNAT family N-acetyltransferase [Breznakiella homolactica]QQO10119.1 GNAT family N-acetyltransferase [Breznakiella homolactica]